LRQGKSGDKIANREKIEKENREKKKRFHTISYDLSLKIVFSYLAKNYKRFNGMKSALVRIAICQKWKVEAIIDHQQKRFKQFSNSW